MKEKRTNKDGYPFILHQHNRISDETSVTRSETFYQLMNRRRTVRDFSPRQVPKQVIDNIILTASTAPSGAHKQPWTFCVITDGEMKKKIRDAAEKEEYESYHNRMSEEWLQDIRPLQTDWHKPFLEIAPYLVVVFRKVYDVLPDGSRRNNYYVSESVGLACGFMLAAVHEAGLAALTHTPSPMNFLTKLLNRPDNERPFLLIPVGYPADETYVPDLERKKLSDVAIYY